MFVSGPPSRAGSIIFLLIGRARHVRVFGLRARPSKSILTGATNENRHRMGELAGFGTNGQISEKLIVNHSQKLPALLTVNHLQLV